MTHSLDVDTCRMKCSLSLGGRRCHIYTSLEQQQHVLKIFFKMKLLPSFPCQIYCCTGFLSLTGQLHQVNADLLGWWLCERQLPSGGLNGRPEKVCAYRKV